MMSDRNIAKRNSTQSLNGWPTTLKSFLWFLQKHQGKHSGLAVNTHQWIARWPASELRQIFCFRIAKEGGIVESSSAKQWSLFACWGKHSVCRLGHTVSDKIQCSELQNTMQSEEQQSISQNCKIVRCEPLRRLQRILFGGKIIQWRSSRCRRRWCCCCWSEEAAPQQARRLWWIEHKILPQKKQKRAETLLNDSF